MILDDAPWTTPPEGERYQQRQLHGCRLHAGSNARATSGAFIGGDHAPWSCSLDGLTPAEADSMRLVLPVAEMSIDNRADPARAADRRLVEVRGVARSQESARWVAESVAGVMSRRVASFRGEVTP